MEAFCVAKVRCLLRGGARRFGMRPGERTADPRHVKGPRVRLRLQEVAVDVGDEGAHVLTGADALDRGRLGEV